MRILAYTVVGAALAITCAREAGAEGAEPASGDATAPGASSAPATPAAKVDAKGRTSAPGELPSNTPPRTDLPRVELHGGAYFWYYQPLSNTVDATPSDNNIELYLASLEFEGRLDDFGLVLNPRFRDSEAREFFTSNVWIEQAYAFYEREYLTIKAGKLYSKLSPHWDNTFYGNIPYFDGIKLDANYGVSFEGSVEGEESGLGLNYFAQYFLLDAGTNGSLRNRDTVWVDGEVHRNHTSVLRAEPFYRFNAKTSLRLGVAGSYTYVDFKEQRPQHVMRMGGDISFVHGPVRVFGEFMSQFGRTVTDYPIARKPAGAEPAQPGKASAHNQYVIAGAEAQVWRFTGRYVFSMADYRDREVTETLHVPSVTIALHDNVSIIAEYAYSRQTAPGRSVLLDNSFNGVIYARF